MADLTPLPVIASVRAAFGFFTAHWRRFAPAALLLSVLFALMERAVAVGSTLALPMMLAALGVALAYRAALYRFALTESFGGLVGLRLGADEGRPLGVGLLQIVFLFLVAVVALAPVGLVTLGMAYATGDPAAIAAAPDSVAGMSAMGPQAAMVLNVGVLLVLLLLIFLMVRLSLAEVATIAESRIVFLKSWPWTREVFWRLLAALILAGLPGYLAGNLIFVLGAAVGGGGTVAMLVSVAGYFAMLLPGGMMGAGVLVYLYRGLRPAPAAA